MNRQERAVRRAHAAVQRIAALDVVYLVDEAVQIAVKAVKTEADVDVVRSDGSIVTTRVSNWRIHREDLVHNETEIRPARGHRIEYMRGTVKQTYEVQPVAGDACYEPADPYESEWKIHSKLISEA